MTLARYVGPRRGLIGTIGHVCDGGLLIDGRPVKCETVPARYEVTRDGEVLETFDTWDSASLFMPGADVAPCVAGLEATHDGEIWRLTVV